MPKSSDLDDDSNHSCDDFSSHIPGISRVEEEFSKSIHTTETLQTCLTNLQANIADIATVASCLQRLKELISENFDNRRVLAGELAGCTILIDAMQLHASLSAEIAECGCLIIANLAHCGGTKARLGEIGACPLTIQLLCVYSSDAAAVKMILWATMNLAVNSLENASRIGQSGGVEAIHAALKCYFDDAGIVQWGLTTLAFLAADETSAVAAGGRNGCGLLVAALVLHRNHPGVVEEVCRALTCICHANSSCGARIGRISGGLEAVVLAVAANKDSADVCYWGSQAFVALASASSANRDRIVNVLGGAELVVKLLRRHINSVAVVEQVCWAAQALALSSGAAAVEALVLAVATHQAHAGILEHACRAIVQIIQGNDAASNNENYASSLGLDVLSSILEAMKGSLDSASACYWALLLLNQLCIVEPSHVFTILNPSGGGTLVFDDNMAKLRSLGAFPIVLNVLERHLLDPLVATESAKALMNLMPRGETRDRNRCFLLVLEALKNHHGDKEVARVCCSALVVIVDCCNDGNYDEDCEPDADPLSTSQHFDKLICDASQDLQLFLEVLKRHAGKDNVYSACKALNVFGSRSSSSCWIGLSSGGCCETAVRLLTLHIKIGEIVEQLCILIQSLSLETAAAVLIGAVGGCEALVTALQLHSDDLGIVEMVCSAINNLSHNNSPNAARFGAAGAAEIMIESLRLHPSSEPVAFWILSGISNLVCNNLVNIRRVGAAEGCEAILETLKRHLPHSGIVRQGCITIHNLCFCPVNKQRFTEYFAVDVLSRIVAIYRHLPATEERSCFFLISTSSSPSTSNNPPTGGLNSATSNISATDTECCNEAAYEAERTLRECFEVEGKYSIAEEALFRLCAIS